MGCNHLLHSICYPVYHNINVLPELQQSRKSIIRVNNITHRTSRNNNYPTVLFSKKLQDSRPKSIHTSTNTVHCHDSPNSY